mmetsp:Transcript_14396/g.32349  ORF Transcript_14396/g.32349 Transcript_14396/m.32349 type:complete len:228 (+) Transcript_14396:86-769(+)
MWSMQTTHEVSRSMAVSPTRAVRTAVILHVRTGRRCPGAPRECQHRKAAQRPPTVSREYFPRARTVAHFPYDSERLGGRLRQVMHAAIDETHGWCGVCPFGRQSHTMQHVRHRDLVTLAKTDVLVEPIAKERIVDGRAQILQQDASFDGYRLRGPGEGPLLRFIRRPLFDEVAATLHVLPAFMVPDPIALLVHMITAQIPERREDSSALWWQEDSAQNRGALVQHQF